MHSGLKYALIFTLILFRSVISFSQSYYITDIKISGLHRTKPAVIYRELILKIGDTISQSSLPQMLKESEKQLLLTNLFLTAIVHDSLLTPNTIYIEVKVAEKWYLIPEPTFELADRNFNSWWETRTIYRTTYGISLTQYNLTGMNDPLKIDFILGWRQKLGVRYKYPYINKKKTIGFEAGTDYSQGHEVAVNTLNNRLKFYRNDEAVIFRNINTDATISYKRHLKVTHSITGGLKYYHISDSIASSLNSTYLGNSRNESFFPFLSYSVIGNYKDRPFYPENGYYYFLQAGSFFDLDRKALLPTMAGTMTCYLKLNQLILLTTGVKVQQVWAKNTPYIFRAALGYKYGIRGYEHYVIEGNTTLLFSNEFKLKAFDKVIHLKFLPIRQFNKVPLALYLKVLYDAGYVSSGAMVYNSFQNKFLTGKGFGLDIVSYYDRILRLEYSFNDIGGKELFIHFLEAF